MMEKTCIFQTIYGRDCEQDRRKTSQNQSKTRLEAIIQASKIYDDDIHTWLEPKLRKDKDLEVAYHKNFVSRYTSKTNINCKRGLEEFGNEDRKHRRIRRSDSNFNFQQHCLYCGEKCDLQKDPRNPSRWRQAYLCRSTESASGKIPYKEYLLSKCDARHDEWGDVVRMRIEGAIDLHAADARYHNDCMKSFFTIRSKDQTQPGSDKALDDICKYMANEKKQIWNAIDLYGMYLSKGGTELTQKSLVERVKNHFQDELLVSTSPGYANILVFSKAAGSMLRCKRDDSRDSDFDSSIQKVAKQIVMECRDIKLDRDTCNLHIDQNSAAESSSTTLLQLLKSISHEQETFLPSLLIGNIVSSMVKKSPTGLQIALGILMRDSKKLVQHLYAYGVTCSYDELQRFNMSEAKAACQDISLQGISSPKDGMVQIIADNFDADISSPNGKQSTHSLAMILTQAVRETEEKHESIRRITKAEISEVLQNDIMDDADEVHMVSVPPKPQMPSVPVPSLSQHVTKCQGASEARAEESDLAFMNNIMFNDKCPEYNGYLTQTNREQGHQLQSTTKVVYLPLIDRPPADSGTIHVSLRRAQGISDVIGQEFVVYTADQQLYKVALHLQWHDSSAFTNVYLRLGGMHMLMSYIGCVGTLMENTGLAEVLSDLPCSTQRCG